jgi:hypothetical protein
LINDFGSWKTKKIKKPGCLLHYLPKLQVESHTEK